MKKWTLEQIRELLLNNDRMVVKSLVKIYEKQTEDEQEAGETTHSNGIGYNATDSYIMSSFAQQVQKGRTLSEKQMVIARRKIYKYAKQLTLIANGEL